MAESQYLGLRAYSFFIKKRNSSGHDKSYELNMPFSLTVQSGDGEVDLYYENALDLFEEFVSNSDQIDDKEETKQLFCCQKLDEGIEETEKYRYFFFAVNAGYYGYASDLVDRISLRAVYKKTKDQADVKRFYVMVVIPKDHPKSKTTRGLLFFQEIGVYGIKTVTSRAIQSYFSNRLGLTFKTQNLAPDFYLKKIFDDGILRKIKLGRNSTSQDPTDRLYGFGFGREERVLTPLRVTKEMKDKLKYVSESKYNYYTFEGIDYTDVRMEIGIGKRVRTINLHGLEDLSVEEALPDSIVLADGTINSGALKLHLIEVANEYIEHLPNSF